MLGEANQTSPQEDLLMSEAPLPLSMIDHRSVSDPSVILCNKVFYWRNVVVELHGRYLEK